MGGYLDSVTRLEITDQQLCCQRVEQEVLNGSFERPSAELGVVTFFGD